MIEPYIPKFFDILYEEEIASLVSPSEIRDAFHSNQIRSKNQAIIAFQSLQSVNGNLLYIGSWIGLLTNYICSQYPYTNVDEIDIDPKCFTISKRFNSSYPNYRTHYIEDANLFPHYDNYDIVVNLSSEHMSTEWFDGLAKGTRVVIQSNNLAIDDHINLCYDIDQMKNKYSLSCVTYESEMKLNVLTRYTLAGIK